MKHHYIYIAILLQWIAITKINAQNLSGQVIDKESLQPLEFVEVYFPELNAGTITNDDGIFKIEHFKQPKIKIQITFIGYETIDTLVETQNNLLKFYLKPSHYELKEVIISATTGKLQDNNIVSIDHKKLESLQQAAPLTLAESISNIPGVEQNTTGTGIGKPVIRGLSGNRIVTYAQGIKIENQQWGDEHGLGIGEIGIESVEVIKGPASLLYGSDALGGVLYFIDERYAKHNTVELKAQSKFLSNASSFINNFGFKLHKNKFKFNLFGSYTSNADYKIPSFETVDNTRFDEKNIKASFGFNTKNWISNIRYSFLNNDFGITEDATFSNDQNRQFELPFQIINNHNLSFENKFYLKEATLESTLGYTSNYRREFEDSKENAALGMALNTMSYNFKYSTPSYREFINFIMGIQGMFQNNTNDGEEILIPDANTQDIGVFGMTNLEWDKFQFQTGIRWDNRFITTIETDHIQKTLKNNYQGITFSTGGIYKLNHAKLRTNISSGFRAPTSSELLSDGVHEGTNRYEKGNNLLKNEQATQLDFSYNYQKKHFQFSLNPFYNYIQNYIYLAPTGKIIDSNPVFGYLQTNAYLYGGEMGVHFHPHEIHWLHFESDLSTVIAEDTDKNALPLIPQTKINTTISAEFSSTKKVHFTQVYIQNIYKFKQDRIGAFEASANAYNLVNLGAKLEIFTHNEPIQLQFGIKNLFNTNYIDHLSRFKKLGIPNSGINFYIGLKAKLDKEI